MNKDSWVSENIFLFIFNLKVSSAIKIWAKVFFFRFEILTKKRVIHLTFIKVSKHIQKMSSFHWAQFYLAIEHKTSVAYKRCFIWHLKCIFKLSKLIYEIRKKSEKEHARVLNE